MRGKKSPMIMGLIGAMLLSTNAFAAVPSDFSDFPTDWSAPAMTHAVQNGLLNGSDGKILPKGLLTRAQMATMVNRAFASSAKASLTSFNDMVPGTWHYNEMAKAVQMGVFQGADGKLSPNDPITREQAFAVLARAFGLADGKASSLDKFSDGAQVSSWAKGAVAALVEQGYVSGADGALNPQSYITRAEFAQVMDALVAAYGDQNLKDQTVEGNLILRSNNTLENVTVKGDLILADGVSAASLKNVTVTGRLVVRGGTDGVSLTKSTAKGGIQLANPNGTPKLTIDGKAYDPNGTTNGGNTSGGSGGGSSSGGSSSGGSSSSGGNSSTKTDLVVAEQTKLVNVDWGQYVAVRFTSGNNLKNCTLTVDGTVVNDACSNVTTDGSIVKWESTTWNPAKLVITKGSQSQTVTLSQTANPATPTAGQKADAYYFLANGPVYVWDYHLTNYDESGAVRYSPKVTTFSLTNEEKDAIKYYSPEAVLQENVENSGNLYGVKGEVELMFNYANGTDAEKAWVNGITNVALVAADDRNNTLNESLKWNLDKNYKHGDSTVACITVPLGQRNFYSNGRYQLRVTSNGTSKLFPIHVVNETKPSMILTDTTAKSGQNVHFRVENMTYGITQPIYRVELTTPDNTTTELTKIDDWYLIGDSFILYNDTTDHIPTVGQYTLTIYADGFKPFTKEFNVTSGQSLQIQKAALPYGVDTYSGSSVSGGGASSGSGSEGGSNTMNAYLVFQADLLVNAEIMTDLGTGNAYAEAIATRWNELTPISVYAKGSTDTYDAPHFFDTLNKRNQDPMTFAAYVTSDQAVKYTRGTPYAVKQVLEDNLLGETTAFSETANKAAPDITLVKLVDGKYVAATEVTEGQDAVFRCLDTDYLTKLAANGYTINTEKGIFTISKEKLTVGDNSITIAVEGYQTVRLSVRYQKVLEEVSLSGPAEGVQLGKPVSITCTTDHGDAACDFLANVTGVTLTGPDGEAKAILPDGQESVSQKIGYTVTGNTLTLGKDLFSTVGNYSVTIRAGHGYEHEPKKVEFEIKAATPETPEPPSEGNKDVPAYESWTLISGYWGSGKLCFGAGGHNSTAVQPYLNAITAIKLGDTSLTPVNYSSLVESGKYCVDKGTDQTIYFYPADFRTTDSTTITIIAEGYKNFTLVIGADGKVVTGGDSGTTDPVDPSEPDATAAPTVKGLEDVTDWGTQYYRVSFEGMDKDALKAYLTKIKLVTVGSTTYTQSSYSSTNAYKLFATNTTYDSYAYDCLDLTSNGFPTDAVTRVAIEAEGYATLTFDVKNGQLVTDSNAGENPGGGESGGNTGEIVKPTTNPTITSVDNPMGSGYYAITFAENDKEWVQQVQGLRVGGTLYSKIDSASDMNSNKFFLDTANGAICLYLNRYASYPCDVVVTTADGATLTLEVNIPFYPGTPTATIK